MKKILSLLLATVLLLSMVFNVSAQTNDAFYDLCFSFYKTEEGNESMVKTGETEESVQYLNPENNQEGISIGIQKGIFEGYEGEDLSSIDEEILRQIINQSFSVDNIKNYLSKVFGENVEVEISDINYSWIKNKNGIVSFNGEGDITYLAKSTIVSLRLMVTLMRNKDDFYIAVYENYKNYYDSDNTRFEFLEGCYFKNMSQEETPTNEAIKILVDGEYIYPDSDPVIVNDRTLVPIRAVAEKLGYNVEWKPEERTVVINDENVMLLFQIDSFYMLEVYYDKQESKELDVAPTIINDRTYLPLRAVGEALGCDVDWDASTRTVIIRSK